MISFPKVIFGFVNLSSRSPITRNSISAISFHLSTPMTPMICRCLQVYFRPIQYSSQTALLNLFVAFHSIALAPQSLLSTFGFRNNSFYEYLRVYFCSATQASSPFNFTSHLSFAYTFRYDEHEFLPYFWFSHWVHQRYGSICCATKSKLRVINVWMWIEIIIWHFILSICLSLPLLSSICPRKSLLSLSLL